MPTLSMPLYVNPQDVIDRMQLQADLEGVVTVVSTAIIGAQLHVQAAIGGELQIVPRNHLYFCDSDSFSGIQPGGVFRLEIPSAWIRRDYGVTVNVGSDWMMSDAQTCDGNSYTIDYDKGYVLVDARRYADKYIQVICTTGFSAAVSTPALPTVPVPAYTQTPMPYSNDVLYMPGNVVTVQTPVTQAITMYLCIAQPPETGWMPPDSLYWVEILQVPVTPTAFDPTVQYGVNAAVTYTISGVTYTFLCAVQPPVGTLPTVTTYWTQVTFQAQQLPAELYEAIMTDIPALLNADQSTNRNAEAVSQYKGLSDHALLLLRKYMRLKGFSFRPVQ